MSDRARVLEHYADQLWRLNNLYWITDKQGREIKFVPNWAQLRLLEEMHLLQLVLKVRQLGMTTFIDLLLLDNAVFNSNTRCGIIAHTRDDAKVIFRDKVKFPFDHLPEQIRETMHPNTDTSGELLFPNNSSIRVGTSMRSGTLQYLHISEHGKICAQYPKKAREIKTGALNTVEQGQCIVIESTAEGRSGDFHRLCKSAMDRQKLGRPPTKLEFSLVFFSWFDHPEYRMDAADTLLTPISQDLQTYFAALEAKEGIHLDPRQRAWYAQKAHQQGADMKREYPSTPDEAFAADVEGAYYSQQMTKMRQEKRICRVPWDPKLPVNTFWDLGFNDQTVIWFHQRYRMEDRFFDYLSDNGEDLSYYVKKLQDKPYVYAKHYLPHDVETHSIQTRKTAREVLTKLGFRPIVTVERIESESVGYNAVRAALPSCWIDEEKCDAGISCLDHYRKEWDDRLGTHKSTPLHDWASHGAKAFEQYAVGYDAPGSIPTTPRRRKKPNWRTL